MDRELKDAQKKRDKAREALSGLQGDALTTAQTALAALEADVVAISDEKNEI